MAQELRGRECSIAQRLEAILFAADKLADIGLLLRQRAPTAAANFFFRPKLLPIKLLLVPASAAVPAAAKQQNEDQNNDEKRSIIHVYPPRFEIARAPSIHSNSNQRSGPPRVPLYSETFSYDG
jgi:hypothetical protein